VKLRNEKLSDKTFIPAPEYEAFIRDIAKDILTE
jgi:hypothetical protein